MKNTENTTDTTNTTDVLFFNKDAEGYKPNLTKSRLFLLTRLIKETLREHDLPEKHQEQLRWVRKVIENLLTKDGDYLLLTLRMLKMGYSMRQTKYSIPKADVLKYPESEAGVYELREFLEQKKIAGFLNSGSEDDNESFRPYIEEIIGPADNGRNALLEETDDYIQKLSNDELKELIELLKIDELQKGNEEKDGEEVDENENKK